MVCTGDVLRAVITKPPQIRRYDTLSRCTLLREGGHCLRENAARYNSRFWWVGFFVFFFRRYRPIYFPSVSDRCFSVGINRCFPSVSADFFPSVSADVFFFRRSRPMFFRRSRIDAFPSASADVFLRWSRPMFLFVFRRSRLVFFAGLG